LRKNGSNLADSNTHYDVPDKQGSAFSSEVLTVNYVLNVSANDVFQLYWQTGNTNVTIETLAATGSYPRTPSVILTATQVMYTQSGYSGTSGYSGFSGISGTNGASGLSGYSGYSGSGISGYSGYSGGTGTNGTSGYSGYSGYSGSGISGYSGYSGATGSNGANGTSGFSGYSGYSGATGTNGASGISGYSGYSGSGISGWSGFSGATGTSQMYGTGIYYNSTTISSNQTIAAGTNGLSAGPITINTGVTVSVDTGSTWVIV